MSYNQSTPDLASVLSILAGLTPQTQNLLSQTPSNSIGAPTLAPNDHVFPQQWHQPANPMPPPRSTTPTASPPNAVKLVDPATIIDWSAGLRCVMKTVAKHDDMLLEIRRVKSPSCVRFVALLNKANVYKMIKNQHEHEELWFKGRKDLIERQKARKEGQKKLDDVLKLVGGSVTKGNSNASPEEMAKELQTFDMKVYKAQSQMAKEMTAALKRLGVPFFGTRNDLVRVAGKDDLGRAEGGGAEVIDETELIKLQRRILVILEDLCSD